MKKKLLVLGMALICVLSMAACGAQNTTDYASQLGVTEADMAGYANSVVTSLDDIVTANQQGQYIKEQVAYDAMESYANALKDIGTLTGIGDSEVTFSKDGVVIVTDLYGTDHDASLEIICDNDLVMTSATTNVKYSFGEMMTKAGLNTLIGMGTVFVILIMISLIIYCFNFIPKVQELFKKKTPVEEPKAAAAAPVIIEEEEDLTDDLELVAVIAAAIAASEGASSADGFQVRSIRRTGRAWKANY